MALAFTNSNSNVVNFGSASNLDTLAASTYVMWVKLNSTTEFNALLNKGSNRGWYIENNGGQPNLAQDVGQSTSTCSYRSSNNLSASTWYFVVGTYDSGATPRAHLYFGTLTSAVVEMTYGKSIDGSGTTTTDAASDFKVGAWFGADALGMDVALMAVWNRALTLNELKAQQFTPHVTSGNVLFSHLGFNGTGTQADWSGNASNGTVTGTAVASHAPIRILMPCAARIPYAVAAVGSSSIPVFMASYRRRRAA